DDAEQQIRESLALLENLGTPVVESFALAAYGAIHFERGDYESASELLAQALKSMPDHHLDGRAMIQRRLGAVLRELGDQHEAHDLLPEAAQLCAHQVRSPIGL